MGTNQISNQKCGFSWIDESPELFEREDKAAKRSLFRTKDDWYRNSKAVCCWRRSEYADGRCALHTKSERKELEDIQDACEDPEQITDGLVISTTEQAEELLSSDIISDIDFSEGNFKGYTFDAKRIRNCDFSDVNLENITFNIGEISNTVFNGSVMEDACFNLQREITGSQFRNADLRNSSFDLDMGGINGSNFEYATLREADLSEIVFGGCEFNYADFTEANLFSTNLNHMSVENAEFKGVSGKYIDLSKSDTHGANFQDATLTYGNFGHNDFTESNISNANFSNARLEKVDFSGKNLQDVTLSGSDLSGSNLSEVDLSSSKLESCQLRRTNLSRAQLDSTRFTDSVLEYANLGGSDLRDAHLQGAYLYQALLTNARINDWTEFDEACIYEKDNIEPYDSPADKFDGASWVYRSLSTLYKNNAMAEPARRYYIKQKEAQRSGYWQKWKKDNSFKSLGTFLISTLNYYTSKHGESLFRVISASGFVVAIFGLLYSITGGVGTPTGTETNIQSFDIISSIPVSLPEWVHVLLTNFYFSAVTFTTLGYGDIQPASITVQWLASVQSFLGSLLMAIFVYVLGRRSNW